MGTGRLGRSHGVKLVKASRRRRFPNPDLSGETHRSPTGRRPARWGAPPVVTYNNVPFDQCSSSEQLRVSLAMGLALNPKLKVILIRDGSLLDGQRHAPCCLDKDNLKMIAEMAAVARGRLASA